MSDLIERQAAIDAIVAWTVEDRPDIEMPTDLVGRINALPSAQPMQWIPCSVEMPISDGIYIVDDRRWGKSWVHTVGYVKRSNSWCEQHGIYYDDKYGRYEDQDNIVAWAYLPTPWEGEQNG